MLIEKARPEEIEDVMALLQDVVSDLWLKGMDQWDDDYPNREILTDDLARGVLYVVRKEGRIIALAALDDIQEEQYANVEWKVRDRKAFCVHRLAVRPGYQGKGVGKALMEFAEDHARKLGYGVMRLDAYTVNPGALALYERRGYVKVGEVRYPGREYPFNCYEKVL